MRVEHLSNDGTVGAECLDPLHGASAFNGKRVASLRFGAYCRQHPVRFTCRIPPRCSRKGWSSLTAAPNTARRTGRMPPAMPVCVMTASMSFPKRAANRMDFVHYGVIHSLLHWSCLHRLPRGADGDWIVTGVSTHLLDSQHRIRIRDVAEVSCRQEIHAVYHSNFRGPSIASRSVAAPGSPWLASSTTSSVATASNRSATRSHH